MLFFGATNLALKSISEGSEGQKDLHVHQGKGQD